MKIQDRLLKIASKPQAVWFVFLLTVCESIFLFIPVEAFIAPAVVANKKNALPVVAAAAIGSLVGGAISYLIGALLFESLGAWLITTFSSPDQFEFAKELFSKHGIFIIFLAAFSPVPYKMMCLAAGFLWYDPALFLGACAAFRTGRFAIAGFLFWRFQEQANRIVRKYFWTLALSAVGAAAAGIFILGLF
ncbi:MAG: VTT domain-containing protein [Rickettsiales bacterium]|jgi:membrane protein YqaA with SNARE-associated domain|nr:VTT domain-containing protein [Rickettsiales bacterium]